MQALVTVIAISDPQWDLQISNISIGGNLRLDLSFLLILITNHGDDTIRNKKGTIKKADYSLSFYFLVANRKMTK